ncbi:hypothetical protein DW955_18905 [Ruminococcus sp. AM45-9BH]|nr:hypothetical protein DW955_18905 [Ruminococcus sp. AM45-9BH]RHS75561.1 hypothetical protein DW953_08135 [Ruminococcus sp. AM45-2]
MSPFCYFTAVISDNAFMVIAVIIKITVSNISVYYHTMNCRYDKHELWIIKSGSFHAGML